MFAVTGPTFSRWKQHYAAPRHCRDTAGCPGKVRCGSHHVPTKNCHGPRHRSGERRPERKLRWATHVFKPPTFAHFLKKNRADSAAFDVKRPGWPAFAGHDNLCFLEGQCFALCGLFS
jgi:hypothetical protein